MPSRKNLSQPDSLPADTTETLPVSPELAALFERHIGPMMKRERQPEEFTAMEYARWLGVSHSRANTELADMMLRGDAERRRARGNTYYYRFIRTSPAPAKRTSRGGNAG